MNLLFLIPLTTGLTASYFLKNTSDEISYLIGSLSFFTLLLSVVLAPWEIKLIVFAIVAIGIYRLWKYEIDNTEVAKPPLLNKSQFSLDSKVEAEPKYRGVTYQPHHETAELSEKEPISPLKYRGIPCQAANSQQQPKPQPKLKLKYRGVSITNDRFEAPEDKD